MTTRPPHLRPNITRVRDASGFLGTVVFVGPVASAKSPTEIYAGIAWDDITRGKHDGSVICRTTNQIIRHFKCGPTQGSFLRLSKLDVGVELTPELMRSRYVKPDAELVAPDNLLPHVARTAGGRDKPIEFWGEVKIRNRQQLEVVEEISLRMLGIARPCSAEQESEMEEFSHLKSIDLAGNLLSDWEDVLTILRQFKNLQSISLASNRVNDLSSALAEGFSMTRVTHLNLNSTNISSFKTVQLIGESMLNLDELCVAHCDLSDINEFYNSSSDADDANDGGHSCNSLAFQNLVLLDLSDCQLTEWGKQVMPFHNLPKLESLILNDNSIDRISIPNDKATMFPKLASLQLAGTSISSWSALDSLNEIPALRSLRLRNTPLTSSLGVGEVRAFAIARLPNLEFFNASPISDRERVEAERRYVSNVARELLMISSSSLVSTDQKDKKTGNGDDSNAKEEAHNARHPHFQSLLEKHKATMISSSSTYGESNQGNIGDDVIGLTIRSMSASSCDMEPLRKRIPRSLKVGRIKAMCARAFGLDIDLQILHFRIEGDPFPTELDDADHTLAYYGVTDGAEILVNEVDIEAREREKARQSEDHIRRVEEQEQHVAVLQSVQRNDHRINLVAAEMSQNKI
ncbi:hypothetical protein ACHAXR_005549 [Thalassiosira sp. AJA248-18]